MNYLVVAVAIFILITTLLGYRRGFLRSVFSVVAMVLSMTLTYQLTPFIGAWMTNNTQIDDNIKQSITQTIEDAFFGDGKTKPLKSRKQQKKALKQSGLPAIVQEVLVDNNNKEFYKALGVDSFTEYVAGYFTGIVMNLLSYLITYLIVWLISVILLKLMGDVMKIPILNGLNRVGGAAFGFAKGMVYLLLFFLVVSLISSSELGKALMQMIQENTVLLWLYEHNPILKAAMDITRQLF